MKFTRRFLSTTLFLFVAAVHPSTCFEGDEEPCPAFATQTTEFPSCIDCISAGCGYVTDEGDCIKDCSTVPDSACFSNMTNSDLNASGICFLAGNTTSRNAATSVEGTEEAMCPESNGDTSTCDLCIAAGCGWTADDGDCLLSCDEVNDGAACVSEASACEAGVSEGDSSAAHTIKGWMKVSVVIASTLAVL